MTEYRPASAVARIAATLIPKHHPELEGVRIEYVFRDKTAISKGKEVWGKARKITGLSAYLAAKPSSDVVFTEDLFVIEIAEPVWGDLKEPQRIALVDHELSHCTIDVDEDDGTVKLQMVPHDLEEFRHVVERHGLWRQELEAFASVIQPRLDF